jgi:predicted ATPase/DNA-binding SARP family transcriptional activator
VQLSILGPVLVDGRAPRGAKERALLARLLVAPGTPVSAAALIEAAWPAEGRGDVTRSLHVRLAKLRALIGPDRIVREPAGYRLATSPESFDALRFAALADAATHAPPSEALARCDEALALWRGEPFADLLLADDAATVEGRRLHAMRDRLRRARAGALAALGRPDEAATELAALVAEDPLREELVADLMSARYAAGRHAEALDAYRELAGRLSDVGLRPGPKIRELETRMLRHADDLAMAPTRATNVGARVTSIVGRDDDLAVATAAVHAHRIVTLVGPAGVGKTTLAAETARSLVPAMPDGAWLVELAPLRTAGAVLPAVASALGMRRVGTGDDGDRDALGILRERLHGARLLVVLDNAEHLVPELGPVVRALAETGVGVNVLLTSRRPLGLPGEAVVPVRPLDPDSAEQLFMARAAAALPDWVADAAERDAVSDICRHLDGLPLAVELAAARLRALSAADIAERLERATRQQAGTRCGLGVLGRGGALDASIEASYGLLSVNEQELFRRLSVFAGPFTLQDAEEVGGGDGLDRDAMLDLLVALTEHSMLQSEGGSPRRYRMLEALRDHGRARLDRRAGEAVARRHAAHFARLSVTIAAQVDRLGAEAVGDPLVPYQWDISAASEWAIAHREADLALELATGVGAFHHLVGTITLGREGIDAALALPGGDPTRRIQAMRWQIALLLCELRLPAVRAAIGAARELIARHGDPRERNELRSFEAHLALCEGDLDAAALANDGVREEALRHGGGLTAAYAAWVDGTIERMRGNLTAAIEEFTRACEHVTELVDICALDNLVAALAEAAAAAGREDLAEAACARALATAPERPLGERNTYLLHEAALAAARRGDLERAGELARAALTGARRDPISIGPWHAPAARGDVALAGGDLDEARTEYEQALRLALDVRAEVGPSLPVDARVALSHLRLAQIEDDAREHLVHAVRYARASRAPAVIAAAEQAAAAPAIP